MWNISSFSRDFKFLCEDKKNDVLIIYSNENSAIDYTYSQVYSYVKRCLSFFKDNGLEKGDTIVPILQNSPEAIICFFASMLGGINYAPLPFNISKREFDNWIKLVKPKMIIKENKEEKYHCEINSYICNCNGDMSWLPINEANIEDCNTSQIYLMTSGTTGTPKAISINSDKFWSGGKAFAEYYKIQETSYRFWNYLPMSYFGGLCNLALIPLCCKGSFVISEPFSGKTILKYFEFVNRYNITAIWLVPTIVQALLKISKLIGHESRQKLANVKIAFLGTAPIQLSMKEEFERSFELKLFENFALSESSFLTAEEQTNINYRVQGSVGKALPYVSLKIESIDNNEKIGKILVKSPFMFDGYLDEKGNTQLELDNDGFFDTKDLGWLDRNEVLSLKGRSRDMIKRGGLLVSLSEIEHVINGLPFIEEAVAVSKKHDFYGEVYILYVVFKEKNKLEHQKKKLQRWITDNFVTYKVPEKIFVYDKFPRTSSGKIQKNKLYEKDEVYSEEN